MKLIVVTPAGREKYLRLLSHYVLGSPEVAEWQLWDNARNEADRAFVHRLAASDPRCRLKQLADADGSFDAIAGFWRYCDDPEALYLRLDDDIVFVEPDFFSRFIARAEAERGKALWFSPVVINNAICNWLLKHLAKVRITGPITAQAMCPHSWGHSNFPAAMHPVFIDAARAGRFDPFRFPDQRMQLGRFSINALGFFGADKAALGDRFYPPEGDEEDWLSAAVPLFAGRYGLIFGSLAVAHFSFFTQERDLLRTDILNGYYELAGLAAPTYRRPRRAIDEWLRDVSGRQLRRPWRKRHPGPQYSISIEPSATN